MPHFQPRPPFRLAGLIGLIVLCLFITAPLSAQEKAAPQTKTAATKQANPPATDSKDEQAKDKDTKDADKKPAKARRPGQPAPVTPIELTRYKTLISIMFNESGDITEGTRQQIQRDIQNIIQRTWGDMWECSFERNDWLQPATSDVLSRVTSEELAERYKKAKLDKVHLLCVTREGTEWQLATREFDHSSQTLTEVSSGSHHQSRLVGELCGQLMQETFRPTVELENANFDELELRLKAGEFPAPDKAAEQIRVGDVIKPYLRYKNKRDRSIIEKHQQLPLTYIVVTWVSRGRIKGVQVSGVMSGLGKKRRSVDQRGYRQRPRYEQSQLRLILRGREDRPLVCHRVEIVAKMRSRDKGIGEPLKLLSDRDGRVTVDVNDKHSHFWVYVYSGQMLLARVPYVPGLKAYETIELPDDKVRLRVEGELSLIAGQLVDNFSRRAAHMAMAKKYAKDGKWDEAQAEVKLMDKLATLEDFEAQINAIQVPAMAHFKARRYIRSRKSPAEKKIERICGDTLKVLRRAFDPEKREKFEDDLLELRDSAG